MDGVPFGRIAALVPEFAVKDLPLGRTLMMMMMMMFHKPQHGFHWGHGNCLAGIQSRP